jgi:hypothetical protein
MKHLTRFLGVADFIGEAKRRGIKQVRLQDVATYSNDKIGSGKTKTYIPMQNGKISLTARTPDKPLEVIVFELYLGSASRFAGWDEDRKKIAEKAETIGEDIKKRLIEAGLEVLPGVEE